MMAVWHEDQKAGTETTAGSGGEEKFYDSI